MFHGYLPKESDIVIIGAGVVGLSIARLLSRYELSIVVIEKEEDIGWGVSSKNMGVVHPFVPHFGTKKFELCLKGNPMFDELSRKLDFPFRRVGLLIVALNVLQSVFLRFVYFYLKRKGIPVEKVSREKLLEMEPNITRRVRFGLYIPTAGVTDPIEFVHALAENAVENGVKIIRNTEVQAIKRDGDYLRVETSRGSIRARFVINAAGLFSDKILSKAGLSSFEMEPGIGVMVIFDDNKKGFTNHIVAEVPFRVDPRTKGGAAGLTVYGHPIWGPNLRLVENKNDNEITREDLDTILRKFGKLFPGITEKDIKYFYLGVRPASKGGDYIIGKTELKGLINVAGIQSPGLTAAPAIALEIKEILEEEGLVLRKKKSFRPNREGIKKVRNMDVPEIDKIVSEREDYAEVICEEPLLTLGEILEAISRGATTIRGVLDRLGLSWDPLILSECADKIALILSDRLNEPFEEITYQGKGTEIAKKG